jgi:hypothetical protein
MGYEEILQVHGKTDIRPVPPCESKIHMVCPGVESGPVTDKDWSLTASIVARQIYKSIYMYKYIIN